MSFKKFSFSKKNIMLLAVGITLIVTCIIAFSIVFLVKRSAHKNGNQTLSFGFYKTNAQTQLALERMLTDFCSTNGQDCSFVKLENLEKNKKMPDIIFAPAGYAQKNATALANRKVALPANIGSQMFSSMKESVIYDEKKIKAVPLFFDNLEIDIEKSEFYSSGLKQLATWNDFEQFCEIQKSKDKIPVCFTGSDCVFLLDFLGALAEALDGKQAYTKSAELLKNFVYQSSENSDPKQLITALFFSEDAPLYNALVCLKKWNQNGWLNTASQTLTQTDINSYAQYRLTNVIVTSLSYHRTYDVKAISRYSSIYFPSLKNTNTRSFTATITYAIPMNTKEKTTDFICRLLSTEAQEELSRATGLAPVLANCNTPDLQADDARYWIAATEPPFAGLGHEAALSQEQLAALRQAVLERVFY